MRIRSVRLLPVLLFSACDVLNVRFPDDSDGATAPPDLSPSTWGWGGDVSVEMAGASFVGEVVGDWAGATLQAPGDMDGDGFGELVIGAPHSEEGASNAGKVYFVQGRSSGWSLHDPLAAYPSVFAVQDSTELSGALALGDVNGDGLADLALRTGYNGTSPPDGAFLVLGDSAGLPASRPADEIDTVVYRTGFDIDANDSSLGSYVNAGDMDGDGLKDWLLTGQGGGDNMLLSGATLSAEMWLPEDASLWVKGGQALAAGDFNGDGLSDLIFNNNGGRGLVLGSDSGLPTGTLTSAAPFQISAPSVGSLGWTKNLGDVNGDGIDDLGISHYVPGASSEFVFLGTSDWSGVHGIEDASAVISIDGNNNWGPVPVGDINGDELQDFAFTATSLDDADVSDLYVFFGRESWPTALDLGDADVRIQPGADGTTILFVPSSQMLGDVNGDGIDDLLVGHPDDDYGGKEGAGFLDLFVGRADWSGVASDDHDVRFIGDADYQSMGQDGWVVVADFNADGFDDVAVSSSRHPLSAGVDALQGEVFVFFGQAGPS